MFFYPPHIRRQKNVKTDTFTHTMLLNGSHFATYHRTTKQLRLEETHSPRHCASELNFFLPTCIPSFPLCSSSNSQKAVTYINTINKISWKLRYQPHNCFSLSQSSADSKDLYNAFKYHCFDCNFQNWDSNWGRGLLKVILEATAEKGVENGLPRSAHKAKKWKNLLTKCRYFLNKWSNEHQNKRKNSLSTQCILNYLLLKWKSLLGRTKKAADFVASSILEDRTRFANWKKAFLN